VNPEPVSDDQDWPSTYFNYFTEIEDHFQRNFGIAGVTGACEYLADRGLIGKASLPVRLTKKSNVNVEELAFFHLAKAPDAW